MKFQGSGQASQLRRLLQQWFHINSSLRSGKGGPDPGRPCTYDENIGRDCFHVNTSSTFATPLLGVLSHKHSQRLFGGLHKVLKKHLCRFPILFTKHLKGSKKKFHISYALWMHLMLSQSRNQASKPVVIPFQTFHFCAYLY